MVRFYGIFWVNAAYPKQDFLDIAETVSNRKRKDLDDALSVLTKIRKPWLLVLDNMVDPEMYCTKFFEFWRLGTILITSRNLKCEKHSTIGHTTLHGLDEISAIKLFYKKAEIMSDRQQGAETQVRDIVNKLHCYPLGILLAGASIKEKLSTLDEYLDLLQNVEDDDILVESVSGLSVSELVPEDYRSSFEASLRILQRSEQQIHQDGLYLLEILAMTGFLPMAMMRLKAAWRPASYWTTKSKQDINCWPVEHFCLTKWHYDQLPAVLTSGKSQFDSSRLQSALKALEELSFVQKIVSGTTRVAVHDALVTWLKHRQTLEHLQINWIRAAVFASLSWEKWGNSSTSLFTTHLRVLSDWLQDLRFEDFDSLEVSRLLFVFYRASSSYLGTDVKQSILLSIFPLLHLDPDSPSVPYIHLYMELISLQDSESKESILAALLELDLPEESGIELEIRHRLACSHLSNNNFNNAIDLLEQVVKGRETVLGKDSPEYELSVKKLEEARKKKRFDHQR